MPRDTELANLYEIFEWSSDAIAVFSDDNIIYVNKAFEILLPYITVGTHIRRLLPEGIEEKEDFVLYNDGGSIRNFPIDNYVCTVKISRVDDVVVVTLSDVVGTGLETAASLSSWIQGECVRLKDPLSTITSALNFIINAIPEDLYPQFSEYLASINQNNYRARKILNNISHIANRLNPGSERKIADISSLCRAFVSSFHSFFAPHRISISADIPETEVLAHCNISEIRRAIYNTMCFAVDCIGDRGTVFLSLSVEDNRAVMRVSAESETLDTDKFTAFCSDTDNMSAQLIKSIASAHQGHLSFIPDAREIELAIGRNLPESEFIRDEGAEYDIGNIDLLTEFSDMLPQKFYNTK